MQVLDCLPEGQYPGSLLIKLGLGTLRQFSESAAEWQAEALKLRKRTSYLLRVHVYQVLVERNRGGCCRACGRCIPPYEGPCLGVCGDLLGPGTWGNDVFTYLVASAVEDGTSVVVVVMAVCEAGVPRLGSGYT